MYPFTSPSKGKALMALTPPCSEAGYFAEQLAEADLRQQLSSNAIPRIGRRAPHVVYSQGRGPPEMDENQGKYFK